MATSMMSLRKIGKMAAIVHLLVSTLQMQDFFVVLSLFCSVLQKAFREIEFLWIFSLDTEFY